MKRNQTIMFLQGMGFVRDTVGGPPKHVEYNVGDVVTVYGIDDVKQTDVPPANKFAPGFNLKEWCKDRMVVVILGERRVLHKDVFIICECHNCINWNPVDKFCNIHQAEHCVGNGSMLYWDWLDAKPLEPKEPVEHKEPATGGYVTERIPVTNRETILAQANELHTLAMPLIKFLRANFNPYAEIRIDSTGVYVLTKEIGIPSEANICMDGQMVKAYGADKCGVPNAMPAKSAGAMSGFVDGARSIEHQIAINVTNSKIDKVDTKSIAEALSSARITGMTLGGLARK